MDVTHSRTRRAYCRVDMCGLSWRRPGQTCLWPIIAGSASQVASDLRAPSVTSKRTGLPVLLWMIEARSFTWPAAKTSATSSFTRSHPRSLLSIARLRRARSRTLPAVSRRTRIAQTCFGRSERFWPTMRLLVQAGWHARRTGRFVTGTISTPANLSRPSVGTTPMAENMTDCCYEGPRRSRQAGDPDRSCTRPAASPQVSFEPKLTRGS